MAASPIRYHAAGSPTAGGTPERRDRAPELAARRLHAPGSMRPAIPALRSEINVTPFVDVCLVMLIIFMVVTPKLRNPGDLLLPETRKPLAIPDEERLVFTLRADGLLRVGESVISTDQAARLVSDAGAIDEKVRLRADRGLPYERIRGLVEELSVAGLRRLELVTVRATPAE